MPYIARLFLGVILISFTTLSGCSNSSKTEDESKATDGESNSASVPTDGLTLTAQTYNKREGSYDEAKVLKEPEESEVRTQFQSLNWGQTNIRPTMKMVRIKGGKMDSMFVVRRNQESAEGEIQAEWLGLENEKHVTRTFSPIETPEAALNLILLYHGETPELRQAVSWTTQE